MSSTSPLLQLIPDTPRFQYLFIYIAIRPSYLFSSCSQRNDCIGLLSEDGPCELTFVAVTHPTTLTSRMRAKCLLCSNCSCLLCPCRVTVHHVKVKPRCTVLTMLKRLDKIRFRGPRIRDDFPDLAESPPASDNECNDDVQLKPRAALRDTEDLLRDPVSSHHAFTIVCMKGSRKR